MEQTGRKNRFKLVYGRKPKGLWLDIISSNTIGYRVYTHQQKCSLYPKEFTDEEIGFLNWLVTELYNENWLRNDPGPYDHKNGHNFKARQTWLGDIVYNKLNGI